LGAKEVIQPFTAVAAVLAEGEAVVHAMAIKTNASEVLEYGEMISVPLHAEIDGEPVELAFAKALAPLVETADCIGIDGYKQPDTPSVLAELFGKPVLYDFDNGDLSLGGSGGGVEDFFVQALGKMVLSDGGLFGVLRLSSKIRLVVCDCSVDSSPTDGSLQAFDIGAGWRNDVWQGPTPRRFQMRMIPKRYDTRPTALRWPTIGSICFVRSWCKLSVSLEGASTRLPSLGLSVRLEWSKNFWLPIRSFGRLCLWRHLIQPRLHIAPRAT
jgi:hypothetical protein